MKSKLALSAALLLLSAAGAAHAQSRIVIVNGALMGAASLARLDRAACTRIPDGSYWLNTGTGAWGYVGNPQLQGVIGDQCAGASSGGINRDGTYGPYPTMRRAEEMANHFRRRGMRAVAFHNGDGYYVRASR